MSLSGMPGLCSGYGTPGPHGSKRAPGGTSPGMGAPGSEPGGSSESGLPRNIGWPGPIKLPGACSPERGSPGPRRSPGNPEHAAKAMRACEHVRACAPLTPQRRDTYRQAADHLQSLRQLGRRRQARPEWRVRCRPPGRETRGRPRTRHHCQRWACRLERYGQPAEFGSRCGAEGLLHQTGCPAGTLR